MQSFKFFLLFTLCFILSSSFLKGESDDNFDKNTFVKAREFQKTVSNSIVRVMTTMDGHLPDRLMSLFEGQRQLSQSLTEIFDKITVEFDKNPNEMPSDTELVINALNKINGHYREFALSIKNDLSDLKAAFKAQAKTGSASSAPEKKATEVPVVETEKSKIVDQVVTNESKKESITVAMSDSVQPKIDREKILQARSRLRKEMQNAATFPNQFSA